MRVSGRVRTADAGCANDHGVRMTLPGIFCMCFLFGAKTRKGFVLGTMIAKD